MSRRSGADRLPQGLESAGSESRGRSGVSSSKAPLAFCDQQSVQARSRRQIERFSPPWDIEPSKSCGRAISAALGIRVNRRPSRLIANVEDAGEVGRQHLEEEDGKPPRRAAARPIPWPPTPSRLRPEDLTSSSGG